MLPLSPLGIGLVSASSLNKGGLVSIRHPRLAPRPGAPGALDVEAAGRHVCGH